MTVKHQMSQHFRNVMIPVAAAMMLALMPLIGIGFQFEASAATSLPDFVLYPDGQETSYFALTLEPGKSETLTVHMGNAGAEPAEARTYAADAYTLVNGGFGNRNEAAGKSGATTWIDYQSETLTLEPGVLVDRTFDVKVPDDAKPGQYISAIVVQTAEPIKISGSDMFQQMIMKSIAVFVTVPGKMEGKFEIGGASVNQVADTNVLEIAIKNLGNILVKPAGTVTVFDVQGEESMKASVAMGSVYAGTETILEVPISAGLIPGEYAVSVSLKDEESGARAKVKALPISIVDPNATGAPEAPVSIAEISVDPSKDDVSGELRFVGLAIKVTNTGDALASTRMTLHVKRDGVLVEDFVLVSSLALPVGETTVEQRYLPSDGWVAGTYEFSITLEDVGTSGQSTVLAESTATTTVVAP